MTDWLMVILTGVYVMATILICIFNYRAAKATREQVAESQRQFEESNRPYVNIIFEVINECFACLTVSNNGNKIAKNLKVQINKEFLELINKEDLEQIRKFNSKEMILGINQKLTLCMGSHIELNKLSQEDINIDISYTDGFKQFEEKTTINLAGYLGILLLKNYHNGMDKSLKNIATTLDNINNNLEESMELDKNVQAIKKKIR